MFDQIAAVAIQAEIDWRKFDRQLNALASRTMPRIELTARVNDDALTKLNRHLDLKEDHARRLQRIFDASPLTPRTDTKHLDEASKKLDAFVAQLNSVSSARDADIRIKADHEINIARLEKALEQSVQRFESLGDEVGKKLAEHVSKSSVTVDSPGLLGNIFSGVGQQFGFRLGAGIESSVKERTGTDLSEVGQSISQGAIARLEKGGDAIARAIGYASGLSDVADEVKAVGRAFDRFLEPATVKANLARYEDRLVSILEDAFIYKQPGKAAAKVKDDLQAPAEFAREQGLKVAGAALKVGAQPFRIRKRVELARSADKARSLADEIEADEISERSLALITGGVDFNEGRNAYFAENLIKRILPDAKTIPVVNDWSNQASTLGGLFKAKQAIQGKETSPMPLDRLLQVAVETGSNPDAIKMAAQAIAYRRKNPDLPINLFGTSGGSYAVEEAIAILERAGVTGVKGVGLTAPMAGLTPTASKENFQANIGDIDPLYVAMFGGKGVSDPTSHAYKKTLEATPVRLPGLISPNSPQNRVIPGAGVGHALLPFVANEQVQRNIQSFLGEAIAPISPDFSGQKGIANLDFYRVRNDERYTIPRTLGAVFGDRKAISQTRAGNYEGEQGYSFYTPDHPDWRRDNDFQSMMRTVKKKKDRASGEVKDDADRYYQFLAQMSKGLSELYEGAIVSPAMIAALHQGSKQYPELRSLREKVKLQLSEQARLQESSETKDLSPKEQYKQQRRLERLSQRYQNPKALLATFASLEEGDERLAVEARKSTAAIAATPQKNKPKSVARKIIESGGSVAERGAQLAGTLANRGAIALVNNKLSSIESIRAIAGDSPRIEKLSDLSTRGYLEVARNDLGVTGKFLQGSANRALAGLQGVENAVFGKFPALAGQKAESQKVLMDAISIGLGTAASTPVGAIPIIGGALAPVVQDKVKGIVKDSLEKTGKIVQDGIDRAIAEVKSSPQIEPAKFRAQLSGKGIERSQLLLSARPEESRQIVKAVQSDLAVQATQLNAAISQLSPIERTGSLEGNQLAQLKSQVVQQEKKIAELLRAIDRLNKPDVAPSVITATGTQPTALIGATPETKLLPSSENLHELAEKDAIARLKQLRQAFVEQARLAKSGNSQAPQVAAEIQSAIADARKAVDELLQSDANPSNALRKAAAETRKQITRSESQSQKVLSIKKDGVDIGQDVSAGLNQGLEQGISGVRSASTRLAQASIDAAKGKLGIKSPSTVFRYLGRMSADGFIEGLNHLRYGGVQGIFQLLIDKAIDSAQGFAQGIGQAVQYRQSAQSGINMANLSGNANLSPQMRLMAARNISVPATPPPSALGGIGLGGGLLLGGAAIAGAALAIKSLSDATTPAALELHSLNRQLASLEGSPERGTEKLEKLRQASDRLGASFSATAQAYISFAESTKGTRLEGYQTEQFLETLQERSLTRGMSNEQNKGMLLGWQQMLSKGKVSQEELRQQIAERDPAIFQVASRAYGTDVAGLNQRVKAGISSTDFAARVGRQMRAEQDSSVLANAPQASFTRLENASEKLKATIGTLLLPVTTRTADAIASFFNFASDSFTTIGEIATPISDTIYGVYDVVSTLFSGLYDLIKGIGKTVSDLMDKIPQIQMPGLGDFKVWEIPGVGSKIASTQVKSLIQKGKLASTEDLRVATGSRSRDSSLAEITNSIARSQGDFSQVRGYNQRLDDIASERAAVSLKPMSDRSREKELQRLAREESSVSKQLEAPLRRVSQIQKKVDREVELAKKEVEGVDRAFAEGKLNSGDYEKSLSKANDRLNKARDAQDNLNKSLETSTGRLAKLDNAFSRLDINLADSLASAESKSTRQDTQISEALALGSLTKGVADELKRLNEMGALSSSNQARSQTSQEKRAVLESAGGGAVIQRYGINYETSIDSLKEIQSKAAEQDKGVIEKWAEIKKLEQDVEAGAQQLASKKVEAAESIKSTNKSVEDFYRAIARETSNLALTLKGMDLDTQIIEQRTNIKSAMTGWQSTFVDEFANNLIGFYETLSGGMRSHIEALQKMQANLQSAQDVELQGDELKQSLPTGYAGAGVESGVIPPGQVIGYSGETGIGSGAHLDVRYERSYAQASGKERDGVRDRVSNDILDRFTSGGKKIRDYGITSEYGAREAPVPGASTYHEGVDFALGNNSPIETTVAIKNVKSYDSGGGGGIVTEVEFVDGVKVNLLHMNPKSLNVKPRSQPSQKVSTNNSLNTQLSPSNAGLVTLNRTGQLDENGLEDLILRVHDQQGNVRSQHVTNSGIAAKQNQFGAGGTTRAGSKAPVEFGRYQINPALDRRDNPTMRSNFYEVIPKFNTDRSEIGFHVDGDRNLSPGSAGCIVFKSEADFQAFERALKESGAKEFVFKDGKDLTKKVESQKPQKAKTFPKAAIAALGQDAWVGLTTAVLESPSRQGRVDALQVMATRAQNNHLGYGSNLTSQAFADGQFQPLFGSSPSDIRDEKSAIAFLVNSKRGFNNQTARAALQQTLNDSLTPSFQAESARAIGNHVQFRGTSEVYAKKPQDFQRAPDENFFFGYAEEKGYRKGDIPKALGLSGSVFASSELSSGQVEPIDNTANFARVDAATQMALQNAEAQNAAIARLSSAQQKEARLSADQQMRSLLSQFDSGLKGQEKDVLGAERSLADVKRSTGEENPYTRMVGELLTLTRAQQDADKANKDKYLEVARALTTSKSLLATLEKTGNPEFSPAIAKLRESLPKLEKQERHFAQVIKQSESIYSDKKSDVQKKFMKDLSLQFEDLSLKIGEYKDQLGLTSPEQKHQTEVERMLRSQIEFHRSLDDNVSALKASSNSPMFSDQQRRSMDEKLRAIAALGLAYDEATASAIRLRESYFKNDQEKLTIDRDRNMLDSVQAETSGRASVVTKYYGAFGAFEEADAQANIAKQNQEIDFRKGMNEIDRLAIDPNSGYSPEQIDLMKTNLIALNEVKLERISLEVQNLGNVMRDELTSQFTDGFSQILTGAQSFSEGLGNILKNLSSKLISMGLNTLFSQIFGSAFNGSMRGGNLMLDLATSLFADGGIIGDGRSKKDDQLILAQRGEGILTHKGVDAIGGERALKLINLGITPKFATGGIIGSISSGTMPRITERFMPKERPITQRQSVTHRVETRSIGGTEYITVDQFRDAMSVVNARSERNAQDAIASHVESIQASSGYRASLGMS